MPPLNSSRAPRTKRRAFTLVELVMAIGVFVFAIVGVVALLGMALQSSSESQRDSALASAIGTAHAIMNASSSSAAPAELFFDRTGSLLHDEENAYFHFSFSDASPPEAPEGMEYWTAEVTVPYPGGGEGNRIVLFTRTTL